MRYYPKDRKLVMNEWGAVIQNQVENGDRLEREKKEKVKQDRDQYRRELDA